MTGAERVDRWRNSTLAELGISSAPDAPGEVWLCLKDATGWLPPPPELRPLFAEWFAEMARRCLALPRGHAE